MYSVFDWKSGSCFPTAVQVYQPSYVSVVVNLICVVPVIPKRFILQSSVARTTFMWVEPLLMYQLSARLLNMVSVLGYSSNRLALPLTVRVVKTIQKKTKSILQQKNVRSIVSTSVADASRIYFTVRKNQ